MNHFRKLLDCDSLKYELSSFSLDAQCCLVRDSTKEILFKKDGSGFEDEDQDNFVVSLFVLVMTSQSLAHLHPNTESNLWFVHLIGAQAK